MDAVTPTRRFAYALLGTSILIAAVGVLIYAEAPTPLQPVAMEHGSASVIYEKASADDDDAVFLAVHRVLAHFVEALERRDDEAMRMDFPGMTPREARLLRAIRARLGTDADLFLASEHMRRTRDGDAVLDFVVLAREPDARRELRLPFNAVLHNRDGAWQIEELH